MKFFPPAFVCENSFQGSLKRRTTTAAVGCGRKELEGKKEIGEKKERMQVSIVMMTVGEDDNQILRKIYSY